MQREELKVGLLIRYIGKDNMWAHSIWKILDIEDKRISMTDMRGVYVKTHSLQILKDFETFIPPDDEPKVRWVTKYLGVVQDA